ncbi:hypothetical protein BD309DRAFT_946256 [Dichomitus squalens]|nr:hypothetical protein BD309DRAFT_946256 [Dichomitus squalens]
MSLKALLYAYVLGGITFLPLVIFGAIFYTIYTSVPVGDPDPDKLKKRELEQSQADENADDPSTTSAPSPTELNDTPRVRKGWLTVRRTFEESPTDASYVDMVRGFLDARSKDPKRSRPKDTWYVALKGKVLYLYEDESMTECEAAIELSGHDVVVFPEGLPDGELFAKRNAICLKPKTEAVVGRGMPSVTREMQLGGEDVEEVVEEKGGGPRQKQRVREKLAEAEKARDEAREQALDASTPWFVFVRSAVEMEDWYLALVHASDNPANSSTLEPLKPVYQPEDMSHLVATLDEQPDVIPMRWLNALLGRIFFSYYRTQTLESYIIGRLMKKISKVKRPTFLTDIKVREVSVGNRAPTLSKPMLKELTKEGDASLEVHVAYKGEVRITVEATATINLGARFKTYVVKLVLALVVREIEGNLLVKVKRPPSSRIWYAFTQMPKIVMDVEPVVSDRQITWSMILSTIESKVREVINESVVLPNMDDISFFESSQYHHRGGIWADASRLEQNSTLSNEQPTSTDGTSATSAPPPETSKLDAAETQRPPVHRSHSAEEVEHTATSTSPPDASPMARATTVDIAPTAIPGTSPDARRRPRLSNGQDGTDTPTVALTSAPLPEEYVSRGRTLGSDVVAPRRSSLPNFDKTSEPHDDTQLQPDDADEAQFLSPTPRERRSPSQHSRSASSRAASLSSSHAGDISDDASDSQTSNYRPKSPASGSSPRQQSTGPATTFLQTLKSRAGDKQALSNTAKETMRKWGVSWGNFRRDTMGSNGSGQSAASADEVPDAGHGDQRRPDSRTSTVRPSYAEVRAAVETRRERERAPVQEHASRSNGAADPIPVPPSAKGKHRAESASPDNAPGDISPASTGASKLGVSAHDEAPTALERTDSQVSASSHHSASQVFGVPPVEDQRPPSTIHTQPPPPKTMSIPGIHASHRGEVMSMGYAPPPPPVPQEPKKAPLQSVYRLWKNPASDSTTSTRSEPAPVSQTGFTGRDQDSAPPSISEGDEGAPLASPQPPRPVPPPLPPRAASTTVHSKPEVARSPDLDASPSLNSMSRASAALQSIASKDREKRASLTPPSTAPSLLGQDQDRDGSASGDLSGADPSTPSPEESGSLDRSEQDLSSPPPSSASVTPTPSHPSSPPPSGRGPPPALPPRRLRAAA